MTSLTTMREDWLALSAEALEPHLRGLSQLAYVDYPDYANVGDSMIAVGAFELLARLDLPVTYVASIATYDPARIAALGPGCGIVINGGGNLGDLWLRHQRFRERVLGDFPDHVIVQLPQSIHFTDRANREAAGTRMRSHKRFHVLCRDEPSLQEARALGLKTSLSPDHALCLPPLVPGPARVPVAVLKRSDKESRSRPALQPLPESWVVRDWVSTPWRPAVALDHIARTASLARWVPSWMMRSVRERLLVAAAQERIEWGLDLVTAGRVLVTDRLHAHVLFCLAGRRHAFVDNSYGKLRAVHAAWTHRYGLATVCQDWPDAIRWIEAELSSGGATP